MMAGSLRTSSMELEIRTRSTGRPLVCFRDMCKRDLKSAEISIETRKDTTLYWSAWRQNITQHPVGLLRFSFAELVARTVIVYWDVQPKPMEM